MAEASSPEAHAQAYPSGSASPSAGYQRRAGSEIHGSDADEYSEPPPALLARGDDGGAATPPPAPGADDQDQETEDEVPMRVETAKKGKGRKSGASEGGTSKAKGKGKDVGAPTSSAFEIDKATVGTSSLPFARVARIIKADQEIDTTSKESVFLVAAATEMFIKHLADQAYANARLDRRRNVQYNDLQRAIARDWSLEFLRDVVPASMPLSVALAKRQKKLEKNLLDEEDVMNGVSHEGDEDEEDADEDEAEDEEEDAEDADEGQEEDEGSDAEMEDAAEVEPEPAKPKKVRTAKPAASKSSDAPKRGGLASFGFQPVDPAEAPRKASKAAAMKGKSGKSSADNGGIGAGIFDDDDDEVPDIGSMLQSNINKQRKQAAEDAARAKAAKAAARRSEKVSGVLSDASD